MSKFDDKTSMMRYRLIAWLMVFLAVCIVGKAAYIMSFKRTYWTDVAKRLKADSVTVKPVRGNILSHDGQLLASSLPEYMMYIDFRAISEAKNDSLWDIKEDSICRGLHHIFPSMSTEEFRAYLREGRFQESVDVEGNKHVGSRHWAIWKKRVSYSTFAEVKQLPLFRLSSYKGGFHYEEFNARTRPNGSLASRTIGEMYGAMDSAKCGLEMAYDSILRGETGLKNRRKVNSKFLDITIKEPVDGADIVTTLDVNIQDLAEKAMIDELKEVGGELGVVIVMEVATGDIKALVNMTRLTDGDGNVLHDRYGEPIYREVKNNAVSDLVEPGSVFKTASILAALDDGVIDTTSRYNVDTGGGVMKMYKRDMRDHNWRRGGYGVLTVPQILYQSSNIGVSRLIDNAYHSHPEDFVKKIHSMGLGIDFDLPFPGAAKHPNIRMPKKEGRYWKNWSDTALPWMSIGYETQIPPIFTVSFYNAIANNGRFMQPRFVKAVQKDGKVIKTYDPVCLIPNICKHQESIKKIQKILEGVVSQGLGKKAGSKMFRVAGKTGTAQIADQRGSYKSGTVRYWLSFAGYFPYDNPKYTCIVCLKKTGLPASGGGMCGVVFHNIAEGIMAKDLKHDIQVAHDNNSEPVPDVKAGNILAADYVLKALNIKADNGWNGSYANGNPVWGIASKEKASVSLKKEGVASKEFVPNVHGMGARDAVYMLESRGLKVTILGRGKVKKQSIDPYVRIKKGMHITLEMA